MPYPDLNYLEILCQLTTIPQLGSVRIRLLIQHFGSPSNALEASSSDLAFIPGLGSKFAAEWEEAKQQSKGAQIIHQCERMGIEMIPYTSPRFPKSLLQIPDYPLILYVQGTLLKEDEHSIAVVGTRNASLYGREMSKQISHQLAQSGFTVISGLARGIDGAAHEGALQGGRTLAVLGSGLANIYPREHLLLAKHIIDQGALISEFPPDTPPDRQTFPQRNRIVSALTKGTLLIEAPIKSGAMITVKKAIEYGRPIFALPGRVDWDSFSGNHLLIKNRQAVLIENAKDIATHYEQLLDRTAPLPLCDIKLYLEPEEKELIRKLPQHELSIEEILSLTELPVPRLNAILMSLVLKKGIKEYPGRIYKKLELSSYG